MPNMDQCLVDSATTHTILKNKRFFSKLFSYAHKVSTIAGPVHMIEGYGIAHLILPNGTQVHIKEALYASKAQRNLLSFKDIRVNGYHIETRNNGNKETLCITSNAGSQKLTLEEFSCLSVGLYYTTISVMESHSNMAKFKNHDPSTCIMWHERLGHPGKNMFRRIIDNSCGHSLQNHNTNMPSHHLCIPCTQGKLITRPSFVKIKHESPAFLDRIQGDICGPIHPASGPFRYFMVLIDASTRWSHVSLLSSRNLAFARLLAQIIMLRSHFPENNIKSIRLDNAAEFTSHAFDEYCTSLGIKVEHPVPHVHTQNGLAEALIKRLQLIARPLLIQSCLPIEAWGHAILHAASLVKLRPTSDHIFSPIELVTGKQPSIAHLRKFGCAVYVPIPPQNMTKMSPQRRLGIYVGFESASIIKYLEPMTGDVFCARFDDCHFDETVFPPLGGDKRHVDSKERQQLTWNTPTLSHLDPRTPQCEYEVRRLVYLQDVANRLPDAFSDAAKVTKSYVPAMNVPARIDVGQGPHMAANESTARRKRGRPMGTKDSTPRKRRTCETSCPVDNPNKGGAPEINIENVQEVQFTEMPLDAHGAAQVPENKEISIFHACSGELWERSALVIDDIFCYKVAIEISKDTGDDDDHEPRSIDECRQREDWPAWKDAIETELISLKKRGVFGPIVETPKGATPVGFKWVFVRKRNERNEVERYKARLVAQGFSQRPGIDYEQTYSPVIDVITFRYLISLAAAENFDMRLMDVVTAYLYGDLDTDIYMKIPEGFAMPETKSKRNCAIKLRRSLYGLKQSGRMWYNRLSEYLTLKGYQNNLICPCVFIKKSKDGFAIVAVYVDDINLIGTPKELEETADYLKREFEMKDLGKTKLCLGLQLERSSNGILLHQSRYTENVLKRFRMDKAHPLSTPMVVRSLNLDKDPYRPKMENEEILGPEVPYLSAIGALQYLAQCTRPDIAFSVNLLSRYSSAPTLRHWNGIKHILRYLRGTTDMGLFYSCDYTNNSNLVGYADSGYLSDPHKGYSQTGYVFLINHAAISWKSVKQDTVATSSNHAELIALHEATRESVWLRTIIQHIRSHCQLSSVTDVPTTIFEDNAACVAQVNEGFVKGDRTKHLPPKLFYTHEKQKEKEIVVKQVRSSDNLADLFTKSLPKSTFQKLLHGIGMRKLNHCTN